MPGSETHRPTALITGASRGLGRALAGALVARGWRVIGDGRDRARLEAAASELGGSFEPVAGDVADPAHRAALVRAVGPRLDALVNNASTLGPTPLRPLGSTGADELRAVLDVNVVAPAALTADLLPSLRRAGGVVLNVSSDAAVEAYEGWGPYGASKAALDHLSRVLDAEEPDVRVHAVDPGDMRTDMHQAAFPDEDISDRPLPEASVPGLLALLDGASSPVRTTARELTPPGTGLAS